MLDCSLSSVTSLCNLLRLSSVAMKGTSNLSGTEACTLQWQKQWVSIRSWLRLYIFPFLLGTKQHLALTQHSYYPQMQWNVI